MHEREKTEMTIDKMKARLLAARENVEIAPDEATKRGDWPTQRNSEGIIDLLAVQIELLSRIQA
jgi:hypothetical protein